MRPLNLLTITSDEAMGESLALMIGSLGHHSLHARNKEEAIEYYVEGNFDVVLVDQTPQGLDAQAIAEALRKLQELGGWRPIIMLTEMTAIEERIAALNAGCDSLIHKPLDPQILGAKIKSFSRIARMQEQISLQNQRLLDYYQKDVEERRISSYLMNRLTRPHLLERESLDYLLLPAADVSGDLMLTCRAANGDLYVMLADATGHGLPAALTLIPLSRSFYAMASKGFSLDSIARTLNRKNREYSPSDRFVAAILALYSPLDGTISVWNGGIPAALLLDDQGQVIRRFRSLNLPLGILSDEEFTSTSENFRLEQPSQLLLYSDGLIEAECPSGEPFGTQRLEQALRGCRPKERVGLLGALVRIYRQGRKAHDDISCIQLSCQPARMHLSELADAPRPAARWGMQLQLTAIQLRELDLEPLISEFCQNLGLEPSRHGVFSLILRELLSNAIDHGLLQLDSRLKGEPDGFDRYIQARCEALRQLQSGEIRIDISQHCDDGENHLRIQVSDSGQGFDYTAYTDQDSNLLNFHGRGLFLLRRLCSRLEFHDKGNRVTAELTWRQEPQAPPAANPPLPAHREESCS